MTRPAPRKPHRRTVQSVLLVALLATAAPTAAQDLDEDYYADRIEGDYILQQTEEEERQTAQELASALTQLDSLRVTDVQIEAAIVELDNQITAVLAEIAQAEAAQEAAVRREISLGQAADAARDEVIAWRDVATGRAVEAYMHPARGATVVPLVQSSDLTEFSRKRVLLDAVAKSDRMVLDELSAAEQRLSERERQSEAAGQEAAESRAAARAAREDLAEARAVQEALKAELEARIVAFQQEVDALEAERDTLNALISARRERFRREAELRAAWRSTCEQGGVPVTEAGQTVDCNSLDDPPAPSSMRWPSAGVVSSEFGPRWGRMHHGLDIAAGYGVPIVAAEAGYVFFSGWIGGYGNTTLIDHGGGVTTLYAHQDSIVAGEGQYVDVGQTIGYIGSTGNSTGPHLHFEVHIDDTAVNPREFLGY